MYSTTLSIYNSRNSVRCRLETPRSKVHLLHTISLFICRWNWIRYENDEVCCFKLRLIQTRSQSFYRWIPLNECSNAYWSYKYLESGLALHDIRFNHELHCTGCYKWVWWCVLGTLQITGYVKSYWHWTPNWTIQKEKSINWVSGDWSSLNHINSEGRPF